MLTTRLWMGSVLIALVVGMLVVDQRVESFSYPFQLVFQCWIAMHACYELIGLLGNDRRVLAPVAYGGVLALTLASWVVGYVNGFPRLVLDGNPPPDLNFWSVVVALIVLIHLAIFLGEMSQFQEPGRSFERMARTWWVIGYLGLLPTCFAQVRRLYPQSPELGTTALALAIFVPKCCDIGAYFTGRAIGKHPMTPTLSPKKTWEGAIGGLVFATLIAIAIDRLGPTSSVGRSPLGASWGFEIAFGLTVGAAGMLGDLAESLIKRDCQQKDASQVVPGFGGVLDVVDAVIFSAPVSYFWFAALRT